MKPELTLARLFFAIGVAFCVLAPVQAGPAGDPVASSARPLKNDHGPTYNGDVASIVDNNCVTCHRDGGIAPFRLDDYHSVRRHIKDIVSVTESHKMPPWKPVQGFGVFQEERRLGDRDIHTLQRWMEEGAVEGTAPRPKPPHFEPGFKLGTPNVLMTLSKPFVVPASGEDIYRCFVLPLPFDKDTAIAGVEFDPGVSSVVHHAFFFLDTAGLARAQCPGPLEDGYNPLMMGSLWDGKTKSKSSSSPSPRAGDPDRSDDPGAGIGHTETLGGWVPGLSPHRFPPGAALIVRKGTDLVLQIHFRPHGKSETVQPRLAIYLQYDKVREVMRHLTLWTNPLKIPANDPHVVIRDRVTLPVPITIYGIAPHAHLLCKEVQLTATLPDGAIVPLVWIKDWDFNWQGQYWYKEPIHLPALTHIDVHYVYDNSSKNPNNPNKPPVDVHNGWHTSDEMMHTYMTISTESERQYSRLQRHVFGREHFRDRVYTPKGEQSGKVLPIALGLMGLIGVGWLISRLRKPKSS